jgi:hypothetical protein
VVPVEVGVVVPATSLFGESEEPGHVDGYGPVPAELVRELVRAAEEAGTARLRRLFADPDSGQLVAMESRSRSFDGGLAKLIRLRDQTCRTAWCDAPIRHTDHARAHASGGATSFGNGQGLCEACDHAKQASGWQARPSPGRRHTVTTTTPTGHSYTSTAPQAIDPPELLSRVELYFLDRLAVA